MKPLMRALSARMGRIDLTALAGGPLGRFLVIGAAGLGVDVLGFTLLNDGGLPGAAARAASLTAATAVTWSLNRTFTFAPTGRRKREEIAWYASVVLAAQGFSYGVFLTLCAAWPQLTPVAALAIGAVLAAALSFGGQRLFTFAAPGRIRTVP